MLLPVAMTSLFISGTRGLVALAMELEGCFRCGESMVRMREL